MIIKRKEKEKEKPRIPSGRCEEEEEPIARIEDDESFSFLAALKIGEGKETNFKFCWVLEELINPDGIDKFQLLEAIVDN